MPAAKSEKDIEYFSTFQDFDRRNLVSSLISGARSQASNSNSEPHFSGHPAGRSKEEASEKNNMRSISNDLLDLLHPIRNIPVDRSTPPGGRSPDRNGRPASHHSASRPAGSGLRGLNDGSYSRPSSSDHQANEWLRSPKHAESRKEQKSNAIYDKIRSLDILRNNEDLDSNELRKLRRLLALEDNEGTPSQHAHRASSFDRQSGGAASPRSQLSAAAEHHFSPNNQQAMRHFNQRSDSSSSETNERTSYEQRHAAKLPERPKSDQVSAYRARIDNLLGMANSHGSNSPSRHTSSTPTNLPLGSEDEDRFLYGDNSEETNTQKDVAPKALVNTSQSTFVHESPEPNEKMKMLLNSTEKQVTPGGFDSDALKNVFKAIGYDFDLSPQNVQKAMPEKETRRQEHAPMNHERKPVMDTRPIMKPTYDEQLRGLDKILKQRQHLSTTIDIQPVRDDRVTETQELLSLLKQHQQAGNIPPQRDESNQIKLRHQADILRDIYQKKEHLPAQPTKPPTPIIEIADDDEEETEPKAKASKKKKKASDEDRKSKKKRLRYLEEELEKIKQKVGKNFSTQMKSDDVTIPPPTVS